MSALARRISGEFLISAERLLIILVFYVLRAVGLLAISLGQALSYRYLIEI